MKTIHKTLTTAAILLCVASLTGCGQKDNRSVKSTSGVSQASVQVTTGQDGLTTEQRNVRERLVEDNKPGSIKHFYVIAPNSGQVLIYSTVKGKVTSSSKRLAPRTVAADDGGYVDSDFNGVPVKIGDRTLRTSEVIQDDGTYGSSVPYIYWWDVKGIYHQHFFTGGQIIHVANKPMNVSGVVLNLESLQNNK